MVRPLPYQRDTTDTGYMWIILLFFLWCPLVNNEKR
nr:MAG TPA: hypothetical protein [Caudoviricetes sp.]